MTTSMTTVARLTFVQFLITGAITLGGSRYPPPVLNAWTKAPGTDDA